MNQPRQRGGFRWSLAILILGGSVLSAGPGLSAPSDHPHARSNMGLSTAPGDTVLMFGGTYSNRFGTYLYLNDTWTWDGMTWTEQHSPTSPSPRCCFGLSYDLARHQVILFGGIDGSTYFDDTWAWDGTTWTQLFPAKSPPSLCCVAMAYDADRQDIVLFGGNDAYSRTWTWDGTTWTREFTDHSPHLRTLAAMAYDRERRDVVMFGGQYDCGELWCNLQDTWVWNGRDWARRRPSTNPPATTLHAMAYDKESGEVVMFGGEGPCCSFGKTWTWNGVDWTHEHPANQPDGRESLGMTWDSTRGQVLLFGGRNGYGYGSEFADTWAWDGSTWVCLAGCR
jgi:Galactose oxidase, central domain